MSNKKNAPPPANHEHPSYGMISLARAHHSSGSRLFGSALESHHTTMRLRIEHGTHTHELHEDRYYARGQIIEVEMSPAQFVEFITSYNTTGIPCTLRRMEGVGAIPEPPEMPTEVVQVRENFAADLQDMVNVMKERRKDIEKLTEKLPAKAKSDLKIALDVMIQQLDSNVPFIARQFNEASDRVVAAAKQEIEAFTSSVFRAAGIEAIADGRLPKMLQGDAAPHEVLDK